MTRHSLHTDIYRIGLQLPVCSEGFYAFKSTRLKRLLEGLGIERRLRFTSTMRRSRNLKEKQAASKAESVFFFLKLKNIRSNSALVFWWEVKNN